MSPQKHVQKEMLRVVYSPKFSKEKKGSILADIPVERLELYRDITRFVIRETLEWVYPLVRKLIEGRKGEKAWIRFANQFVTAHPPTHFALIPSVEKFPFLFADGSWMRELAEYELLRTEASNSPDPGQVGETSHAPGWLDPSFRLKAFQYDVPVWFQTMAQARGTALLKSKPKKLRLGQVITVAIFNDPVTREVRTLELQPAAFAILMQLYDGKTLDEAVMWVSKKFRLSKAARCQLQEQVPGLVGMLILEKAAFENPLLL